jgi:hypothetical protein
MYAASLMNWSWLHRGNNITQPAAMHRPDDTVVRGKALIHAPGQSLDQPCVHLVCWSANHQPSWRGALLPMHLIVHLASYASPSCLSVQRIVLDLHHQPVQSPRGYCHKVSNSTSYYTIEKTCRHVQLHVKGKTAGHSAKPYVSVAGDDVPGLCEPLRRWHAQGNCNVLHPAASQER